MSLDRARLEAAASGRSWLGKSAEHHATLPSTNDRAKELADGGAVEGTIVVADAQTKGRGRLSRAWSSPPGGLYLSVILRPDEALLRRAPVTLIAGLAASEALDAAARVATSLKWPNDVLLDGKKIGGILAELGKDASGGSLVLGVGLNVATDQGELPPGATSLLAAKGRAPALEDVLRLFLEHLEAHWDHVKKGGGPVLLSRAADRMPMLRGRVRVRLEGRAIEGQSSGLNATGALVVALDDGGREVVYAGEAEEVRPV